ncbi:glycosyltransferase [Streptomyces sp. NPDC046261]|uniref:glycosyltransferase n=1 Tax=Streptomyces sp. NPDC046261 TaxID=3157200 RepID=UPI00340AF194
MRVLIVTVGSWGDVAPYTGLGVRMRAAGHEVALATHARYARAVEDHGLAFRAIPVDPREVLMSAHGQGLARASSAPAVLAQVLRMGRESVPRLAAGMVAAVREGTDVLLASAVAHPLCATVAEARNAACIGAYLQPLEPTGAFAPVLSDFPSLGRRGNRLAGHLLWAAADRVFAPAVADLRRRLGLPERAISAVRRAVRAQTVCHGFSPTVVPVPADWPSHLKACGYWWPRRPAGWRPDDRLTAFLEAGPAPVFVGFGSFVAADAARLSELVTKAVRAAGMRAVVQSGWTGLRAEGDDVLTVSDVPHDWLFPHMAAVVHHAGAGTTAAGLRAGVPAVPVPVQLDQYFWAARLVALGTAPTRIPYRHLTVPRLADAVHRAVREPAFGARSRRVATRLAAEDGTAPVLAELARLEA